MLEQTVNPIMDVLRQYPQGITAKAAAPLLHLSENSASTRLSRLALYGVIARVKAPDRGPTNRAFAYRLKEAAHVCRP